MAKRTKIDYDNMKFTHMQGGVVKTSQEIIDYFNAKVDKQQLKEVAEATRCAKSAG